MVKTLRLILLLSFTWLCTFAVLAQAPAWQWAVSGADAGESTGNGIAVNASGNVYVTGVFTGDFHIGTVSLSSAGGKDVFIAKYTHGGQLLWAKSSGGPGDDEGAEIAIDASGNFYVAGYFSANAIFETNILTSAGEEDIFLAKYSSDGNLMWIKQAGGIYRDKIAAILGGIAIDMNGRIYLTGFFADESSSPPVYGTAAFDAVTLTSAGGADVFLAKYDSEGNVLWAKSAGGRFSDRGQGVGTDSIGNIFITGSFDLSSSVYFDTIKLNSEGFQDMFIAKYDSIGNVVWAKSAGSSAPDYAVSLVVDDLGDAYITGIFNGPTMKFGTVNLVNRGNFDIFIAKYNASGYLVWAKNEGWTSIDGGEAIAIDKENNLYVTGSYTQYGVFGNDSLTGFGGPDVFVSKYDKNGNHYWVQHAGGNGFDEGFAITVDGNGHVFLTGRYGSQPAAFGQHSISAMNDFDMFVAKLEQFPQDVPETMSEKDVLIYPNPVNDVLWIQAAVKLEYCISDLAGRNVSSGYVNQGRTNVNTTSLSKGLYIIELSRDGKTERRKFVKH